MSKLNDKVLYFIVNYFGKTSDTNVVFYIFAP
jgi:hypothetical protein